MDKNEWLNSKKTLLGPFVRIPRPEMIELLSFAGFDFAVVDLEHGSIMPNELYPLILAAERRGIRLIARLPLLQENYFKWLLDLNIGGLQIPHIKTAQDAAKAVNFSKFAPEGERGLCRFVRAAEFSNIPKEEYIKKANKNTLLILQIEGVEGVKNLKEIIEIPGIDLIFVGPYDLSQSLGLIGQIWHEKVVNEIKRIIELCSSKGIALGVFTDTKEGVKYWRDFGVTYINYRIDVELFLSLVKLHINEVKEILN